MKGLVYCQQVDGRMNCALLSVGDETATSSGQRLLIKYYNIYPAHAYYFYFIFVLIQFKL